jgi:hypothetical protein
MTMVEQAAVGPLYIIVSVLGWASQFSISEWQLSPRVVKGLVRPFIGILEGWVCPNI